MVKPYGEQAQLFPYPTKLYAGSKGAWWTQHLKRRGIHHSRKTAIQVKEWLPYQHHWYRHELSVVVNVWLSWYSVAWWLTAFERPGTNALRQLKTFCHDLSHCVNIKDIAPHGTHLYWVGRIEYIQICSGQPRRDREQLKIFPIVYASALLLSLKILRPAIWGRYDPLYIRRYWPTFLRQLRTFMTIRSRYLFSRNSFYGSYVVARYRIDAVKMASFYPSWVIIDSEGKTPLTRKSAKSGPPRSGMRTRSRSRRYGDIAITGFGLFLTPLHYAKRERCRRTYWWSDRISHSFSPFCDKERWFVTSCPNLDRLNQKELVHSDRHLSIHIRKRHLTEKNDRRRAPTAPKRHFSIKINWHEFLHLSWRTPSFCGCLCLISWCDYTSIEELCHELSASLHH